jgi:hypothetical protein
MTAALSLLLENKMPIIENDKDHHDSDSSHQSADSEKEDHHDSDTNHNSPLNHLIDKQVCHCYCSLILVFDFRFGSTTFNPIWSAGFCREAVLPSYYAIPRRI